MVTMSKHLDSIRYSNDGTEFHVLWTARKALRLLDFNSGLNGVTVEGISPLDLSDGKGVDAGLLGIDTAEYYGGVSFETAGKVICSQLKHSTLHPTIPWELSSGELSKTLKYFGDRYKKLVEKHGERTVSQKVQFQFVTNRPVSKAITTAISVLLQRQEPKNGVKKTVGQLERKTGLNGKALRAFLSQFVFSDLEAGHIRQDYELQEEIGKVSTVLDLDAHAKLKQLVHAKARSESARSNMIRRDEVLAAFNCHETDIFPAQSKMQAITGMIPREQETEIINTILGAKKPVIVRGAGGMGKSVLAQRIAQLLPAGSESVLFDGFAGGNYRAASNPRHKHRIGLVQLANTLASRSLCYPILPKSSVEPDVYIRAFISRLLQATSKARQRNKSAILLIILDAADNSMLAAKENSERSFVSDLFKESLPEGCHLVGFTRPEREYLLNLPDDVIKIDLKGFTIAESGRYLRQCYPAAVDSDIARFHRLTGKNPRVQANAISLSANLPELIGSLGPNIKTVQNIIADQLNSALSVVIKEQGEKERIHSLCSALAILPPFVPISILADVADVPDTSVRSFVSDFAAGQKLLISDDSVQFHDEPVEDWFQRTFPISANNCAKIAKKLASKVQSDKYVAMAMPRLLLRANKYPELINLALDAEKFKGGTEIEQREILLETIHCAMKAAIAAGRVADVAKLMYGAGEEFAIEERYADFLFENADLVSRLSAPQVLLDLVFRKRVWRHDPIGYVQCASLLSNAPQYRQEADRFLQLAMTFLEDWASNPNHDRQQITPKHLTAYAYATLRLHGVVAASRFISRCISPLTKFQIARSLVRRLVDAQEYDLLGSWQENDGKNIYFRLGLVQELVEIGKVPSKKWLLETLKLLKSDTVSNLGYDSLTENNGYVAIAALAEASANAGVSKRRLLKVLSTFAPEHKHSFEHWQSQKDAVLRVAALAAVLKGRELSLSDVTPESLVEKMSKSDSSHDSEVSDFKRNYAQLLPWYTLRTKAIVGDLSGKECDAALVSASGAKDPYAYYLRTGSQERLVTNKIPSLWGDTLVWARQLNKANLLILAKWVGSHPGIFTPTFIGLARTIAQNGQAETFRSVYRYASLAENLINSEHSDAKQDADSYMTLARAFLPVSTEEATEYLGDAFRKLHGLGIEVHNRFFALTALAQKAGSSGKSYPIEAYQLARTIEVFESLNSHKFPWDDAISAVGSLCPKSGLAIASRWDDRNKAWLGRTLPQLVLDLIPSCIIETYSAA